MVLSFTKNNVCCYPTPLDQPPKTHQCPEYSQLQKFSMKELASESHSETTHLSSLTHWGQPGLIQFLRLASRKCKASLLDSNMANELHRITEFSNQAGLYSYIFFSLFDLLCLYISNRLTECRKKQIWYDNWGPEKWWCRMPFWRTAVLGW